MSPVEKKPSEADVRRALRSYEETAKPEPEKGMLVDTTDSGGVKQLQTKPAPKNEQS